MKSSVKKFLEQLKQKFHLTENNNHVYQFLTQEKFKEFEKLIGCSINSTSIFVQALVHRSFLEERSEVDNSNERLEFLGDSVLSLVVTDYLFSQFPNETEGFLTKVRAKIVNRKSLALAAESINLADFILLNKNLPKNIVLGSKSILSDAFEAVIGAIYLDSGIDNVRNFIKIVLLDPILKEGEHLIDENYKSQLLEFAQANKMETPAYHIIQEDGPQHERIFTVKVTINSNEFGTGKGKSKKSAEQKAAKEALENLKNES